MPQDIANLVCSELSKGLADEVSERVVRQLRRLVLVEDEKRESLRKLEGKLDQVIEGVVTTRKSLDIEARMLEVLDRLSRTSGILGREQVSAHKLVREAFLDLAEIAQVKPVGMHGETYPELGCKVIGVVESLLDPPGTIVEIVRQGYVRGDGSLVRESHVIVATHVNNQEVANG